MTLSNDPAKEIKLGNGTTTVFSFTFKINTSDDMSVTYTNSAGVETEITEGTGVNNYSISVANYPGNGSITYPATLGTKLPTNDKLTLARLVDVDQETDLQNQAQYKPETVEAALDYSRMVDLQQQEQLDRSIKAPISDNSGADYTLPTPTPDTAIGAWNSDGTAIVQGPSVSQISSASSSAVAAAASAVTSAASAVDSADSAAEAVISAAQATSFPFTKEFISDEQVITLGGSLTIPHGLLSIPNLVQVVLVCKVADLNYSVGNEIPINIHQQGAGDYGQALTMDSVNVNVYFSDLGYQLLDFTARTLSTITPASWKLKLKVWSSGDVFSAIAMGMGQSLIVEMSSTTFISSAGTGSSFTNAAVDGSAMTKTIADITSVPTKYWFDDSLAPTYSDGPLFTSYLAAVDAVHTSRTDVNVVCHQQWNQSRSYVTEDGSGSGEITKAKYKAVIEHTIVRLRAVHGGDVKIIFGMPHRRTSGNAQENYGCQAMREVYFELVDGDVNIFAVEHCDIDLVDATHQTVAGREELGSRFGLVAQSALNGGTGPIFPLALTATLDYNEVTFVLDNDVTAPSSGVGQVTAEQASVEVIGSSLVRTTTNTCKLTLPDNGGLRIDDTPYLRIGSGLNATLASTGADTLNNFSGTYPARSARIAITDGNAITSISNVKEFWDAKHSKKTYSAGVVVGTIQGLKGSGMDVHPNVANDGPVYDSALFSGRGGLTGDANSCLQYIDAHLTDGTFTFFGVFDIPASPTGTSMAGIAVTDASIAAKGYIYGSGANISYARNQANGFQVLFAGATGGAHVIMIRYNSLSSADCYIDSDTVTFNFDPRDDFSLYDNLQLFAHAGTTNGIVGLSIGAFGASDNAFTDAEVTTIMNELGTEFGITIT